jgi:hypothetical protein
VRAVVGAKVERWRREDHLANHAIRFPHRGLGNEEQDAGFQVKLRCARRVNAALFPDCAVQAAGLFEGVQQRVCIPQVCCLEPFREPVIDWLKHHLRVGGAALIP